MTDSPTLFSEPVVRRVPVGEHRRTDPATAVNAARLVDAKGAEAAVRQELARFGWLTASEICGQLPDIYGPTLVSALSLLRKAGEVVATGTTRKSARNRDSIVWRLATEYERLNG